MKIQIIGAESLGVRGLCCLVQVGNRRILIDPGISLGFIRNGLKPHPVQIAVGRQVKQRIIEELSSATDLVISHFHGDHIPLNDANFYQLSILEVEEIPQNIWAHPCDPTSRRQRERELALVIGLDRNLRQAEGKIDEVLSFSDPVPHGQASPNQETVSMTIIDDQQDRFLHASDIQFLHRQTIDTIIELHPDIVLASGPPLYLIRDNQALRTKAWNNILKLSEYVPLLILDHHLLRSTEGALWLDELAGLTKNKIICAADFMKINRYLLEAMRTELYQTIPVPDKWHEELQEGSADPAEYLKHAAEAYDWFSDNPGLGKGY
ncbi:MAG TPA: hypothetical protein GXZ81_05955 [Fastidiosipila sp.]|jgi:predicted metallo-beta-lactamase superfamily hydrolase|nr:hypothetical protein [Fastidiosipila sp.]